MNHSDLKKQRMNRNHRYIKIKDLFLIRLLKRNLLSKKIEEEEIFFSDGLKKNSLFFPNGLKVGVQEKF